MKHIKHTMAILLAICTLTLIFSGCHKEKITKWKYVGYEGCNIELTIDNEADLVYVSADYSGFIEPIPELNYQFLFYDNTTYKKIGDTLREIDPFTNIICSTGFVIVSQNDEMMNVVADSYFSDCDALSHYITDYHFVRIE
ncbi:MAG: hypothetical protein MJZ87_08085 [Bacteroidales bacterium]|nr:hypothetical protein [Bacteroidales bacterium]